MQEMRRQGLKSRLVAGSTIGDSELARRMGDQGNGTVIPTTFYSGSSAKAKAFEDELIRRAKAAGIERSAASQFEAATYDIVQFYAYAMKEAKVTGDAAKLAAERTAIRDTLRAMKNYPALEGRLLSSSYTPQAGDAQYAPMLRELRRLFDAYQINDRVTFAYDTRVYYGQLG